MATKEQPAERPRESRPPATRLRHFQAPAELPAEFGLNTQDESDLHGVITTEQIRSLLDAFGLESRKEIAFPFQHIVRRQGEIHSLRIEPLAVHQVEGKPVMGHAWAFIQQQPERVRSVQ